MTQLPFALPHRTAPHLPSPSLPSPHSPRSPPLPPTGGTDDDGSAECSDDEYLSNLVNGWGSNDGDDWASFFSDDDEATDDTLNCYYNQVDNNGRA